MLKKGLHILLCLTLIQSSFVQAQGSFHPISRTIASSYMPIEGVLSPEGRPVYLDSSTHSMTKNGVKVYAELSDGKGFRNGLLQDGTITWQDGKSSQVKAPPVKNDGRSGRGIERRLLPSQLAKTFGWRSGDEKGLRDQVKSLKSGDFKSKAKSAAKTAGKGAIIVGGGALAFYAAMAIGAAFKMSTQHGNDPRAFDAFLDEMKDPYSHMTLGIFAAAMGSVYLAKRATGRLGITKTNTMGFGSVAMGLGLAIVANTAFSNIVYHEKFDQCWGFDHYLKTGSFKKDLRACDEVAMSVETRKLADDVLPALISGSLALGIVQGGRALLMSQSHRVILQKLSFQIARIPKSNWVTAVGSIVLFSAVYTLINDTFGLGQIISELQMTKYSFKRNTFGATISANHNLLMTSYSDLMKNPYKDLNWNKVCVRQANGLIASSSYIEGQRFELYNCDNEEIQYLPGILAQYKELSQAWRGGLFTNAIQGHDSYVDKTNGYYTQVNEAHKFYYTVLAGLQKEASIGHTLVDEVFLSDFEKTMGEVPGASLDGFLNSMVCGPKVSETSKIALDSRFHDLKLNPPRLTNEKSSNVFTNTSICSLPEGTKIPRSRLLSELKDSLNVKFKGENALENFQEFWSQTVTAATRGVEEDYFKRYQGLLKNSYLPALKGDKVYSCDVPKSQNHLELFKHTHSMLSELKPSQCSNDQILRVYESVEQSMGEELRIYLSLLSGIHSILRKSPNQKDERFDDAAKRIMTVHKEVFEELGKLEGKADVSKISENLAPRFRGAFIDLTQLLSKETLESEQRVNFAPTSYRTHLFNLSELLLDQIGETFLELKDYLDILKVYDPEVEE